VTKGLKKLAVLDVEARVLLNAAEKSRASMKSPGHIANCSGDVSVQHRKTGGGRLCLFRTGGKVGYSQESSVGHTES